MTAYGQIPPAVLANAEKRLAASRIRKPCTTPGCDQPATHWPATGHPACETHRIAHPVVPDPTRTLAALKDRRRQQLQEATA